MNPFWLVVFAIANWATTPQAPQASQPFAVQYARSSVGREVTVCIDGQKVERTFAGKMTFRDQAHTWQSVCADVRSPVAQGQTFPVRAVSSKAFGGNIAKAGNIVAQYFKSAQSADECAALQIAVWKAIEDGSDEPDFGSGHFQVMASPLVISLATKYYQATQKPGDSALIQATTIKGQSQLSTVT